MKIDKTGLLKSQMQLLQTGFLSSDRSWVICAPTGAGKTLMGEWALQMAVRKKRRGAYLAPLKAIVEEKATDWAERYPEYKIGLYTGETTRRASRKQPTDEQFLLMTPEKLASYLHGWKRHLTWLAEIDVVVIDEFHLLGDPNRGPIMESLIGRIQRINPFVRFVGLSATVPNSGQLASWLNAEEFITTWRPVPLTHRVVRFRKASNKPQLLENEVAETICDGGRVLVFVNSRRRSERLSEELRESGYNSNFYHAGLNMHDRSKRQDSMRGKDIDVLVSTSSLEMGVNFPARKVVVYDSYTFNGDGFGPMPVGRYIQCAGRAGRPGFDSRGESVIFLPMWHKDGESYKNGEPESVKSGLSKSWTLQKEIITEVASRLSISIEHLKTNFSDRTFRANTEGPSNLAPFIDKLMDAEFLKKGGRENRYLTETPLGLIATQMDVSPETVQILDRFYQQIPTPSLFDCALATCLCPELTPKLPFNFEQIDEMGDLILNTPSHLLNAPPSDLASLTPGKRSAKELLSVLKTAVIIMTHTTGESLESLADRFDCYPMDISIVKRNCDWILSTALRVFAYRWRQQWIREFGKDSDMPRPLSNHEEKTIKLIAMIKNGLPAEACDLVNVKGIGPKRALNLYKQGIKSLHELADAPVSAISEAIRLSSALSAEIKDNAKEIMDDQKTTFPFDSPQEPPPLPPHQAIPGWPQDVDPYRLRRSLELRVTHRSEECVQVEGGTEPHSILIKSTSNKSRNYTCDCADFAKGNLCKHIMRARLEYGDGKELIAALRSFQIHKQQPLRYAIAELWIKGATLYDRYEERPGEYDGMRFLERNTAGLRWNR